MDAVDAYHASKQSPAGSLLEAFANTAKALQQFGLERVRVVGLSKGCCTRPDDGIDPVDGIRIVTEHEFMREFVFLSRPCVILDAIEDWPAMQKWRSDRYLFDLDGHLPLVEQKSTSSEESDDDDGDNDDGDSKGSEDDDTEDPRRTASDHERQKADENEAERRVATAEQADEPQRPLGPKRFTIALTPNGRADAVTHVLYDERDVPDERKEDVFSGRSAQKAAVPLSTHPLLPQGSDEGERQHLRVEKLFMYAAEVKITLPELYKLFLRGPKHVPDRPIFIDMRAYKNAAEAPGAGQPSAMTPVIAYAQLQNNCLNTEFTHVHADITTNIEEFGTRVFGEKPEAANVWFGIPASVSSMHQDWVENLYPVVRGVKEFILIPPWEGVFVPKPDIPSAAFSLDEARTDRSSLTFAFKPYPEKDGTVVPWMDFDFTPDLLEIGGEAAVLAALNERIDENEARKQPIQLNNPLVAATKAATSTENRATSGGGVDSSSHGRASTDSERKLKELHPLVAYVHPGETLYLPAMWLHRVAQHADEIDIRARARHHVESKKAGSKEAGREGNKEEDEGIDHPPLPLIAAVNYWYNMNFLNPAVVLLREFGLLL